MEDKVLSINPLELLTCAMTLRVSQQELMAPEGSQVVWRNDNVSAITDLNNTRAKSAPMLEALKVVLEMSKMTDIRPYSLYISSEENKVADYLSRGRTSQAVEEASKFFGFEATVIAVPPDFSGLCNRVARAAYRSAGKPVPSL